MLGAPYLLSYGECWMLPTHWVTVNLSEIYTYNFYFLQLSEIMTKIVPDVIDVLDHLGSNYQ